MVRVVHEHSLAPDVLVFLRVPSKPHLHGAVYEVFGLNGDALVQLPLIEATFVATQHEFCHKALLVFNPLKLFKLDTMGEADAVVSLEGLVLSWKSCGELAKVNKLLLTILEVLAHLGMLAKSTFHDS